MQEGLWDTAINLHENRCKYGSRPGNKNEVKGIVHC